MIFRNATTSDIKILVPLFAESSGGVWPAVWKDLAFSGESLLACATRLLSNTQNNFSLKNIVVAESQEIFLGAMATYCELPGNQENFQSSDYDDLSTEMLKALSPYGELSDPDSWFIAEICVLPVSRGKGLGTLLLENAKQTAIDKGFSRLSLRVFSENTSAIRLYERFGFEIRGTKSVVPHPEICMTGNVHLMTFNIV